MEAFIDCDGTEIQTMAEFVLLQRVRGRFAVPRGECKVSLQERMTEHLERPVGASSDADVSRLEQTETRVDADGVIGAQIGRWSHPQRPGIAMLPTLAGNDGEAGRF